MTKRVVLIVVSIVLMTLGTLAAIAGGVLMALVGPNDTLSTGTQQVSTPTSALVSAVAVIQNTGGVRADFGSIRLRVTATSAEPGRPIFIGIGPAAAVDRYLSGVGHDVVTDVSLTPFHLTLVRSGGTASPAPPGSQPFWIAKASGTQVSVSWTITDGSFRLVVMNADGTAPVRINGQLALTVPHLFAISVGFLVGGVVVLLAGLVLLLVGLRSRPRPPGPGVPSQAESGASPWPGPDGMR